MINGGSFSASSLISSNLKLQKSNFVGEETGEPLTERVGFMPVVELPF
jgi:hypothetical protein